jgi:hypothetical protein
MEIIVEDLPNGYPCDLLWLELETFVLFGDGVGVFLEGCKLGFEVFDAPFFAFAEGSLSVKLC